MGKSSLRLVLLAIGLLWTAGGGPAAAATNLIRNGGFEEGPGSYPGVGKYWETNDAQPHPAINVLTAETKHSGGFSQLLKAHSQWDLGAVRQVSDYNTVTPGKTYRIQAWIKTANVTNPAGWYVFGVIWFHNDIYITDSKMPQQETNNYDWRLISWDAVAPQYANRVAALLTRHTDGDAWYDDVYIGEVLPGQPEITCAPASFSLRARSGGSLPNDSVTILNSGGGTLNYTISSNAAWISLEPDSGVSVGDLNTCTVSYALQGLALGSHTGTIAVVDPSASNSPQTVTVTLQITRPGDFDQDGDVDQEDFGRFQACFTGDGQPQSDPACSEALMDADDDVDLADFVIWQQWFTGPDNS